MSPELEVAPLPESPVDPTMLPNLIDIVALADHLGVDVRHIRRLVSERRIPFIKWGHLLRFDPTEIADWLEDKRRQPDRQAAGW